MLSPVVSTSRTSSRVDRSGAARRRPAAAARFGESCLHADAEVADHRERQASTPARRDRDGCESDCRSAARLDQRLVLRRPVPALAARPLLPFHEHFVGVFGVRRAARRPSSGSRLRSWRTATVAPAAVVDLDARRPVGRRLRADRVFPRRMHVFQVVVVDDLPVPLRVGTEIEGTPGDERGFVTDGGQVDVGLGMKLRHSV